MKIYLCRHCGNVVVKLIDSGVNVVCCGEDMMELVPNTVDAATEKHIPVINKLENGYEIKVGSVIHPMSEEHYISFIIIHTDKGFDVKYLNKNDEPVINYVTNDKVLEVYAYCNLHGLWKKEI